MPKMQFSFLLLALVFSASCTDKLQTEWVSTTTDSAWVAQNQKLEWVTSDQTDAIIDMTNPLQTIDGFGACFNELGWTSLNALNENDRNGILKEMFEPGTGANFTICRMPLGANDFARDWYSLNETEGDFEMKNFSIANDKETLIPFIENAKQYNPAIKIWASPWSPPSWMKYNKHYACCLPWAGTEKEFPNHLDPKKQGREGSDMFIQQDAYLKAYALYFSKFVEVTSPK